MGSEVEGASAAAPEVGDGVGGSLGQNVVNAAAEGGVMNKARDEAERFECATRVSGAGIAVAEMDEVEEGNAEFGGGAIEFEGFDPVTGETEADARMQHGEGFVPFGCKRSVDE